MKQTAVEWFSNQAYALFEHYSEGKFDRITLNKLMLEETVKAKAMEKEQMIDAATWGALAETGEQYYNETFKTKEI
jgi:hypothetical protein